MIRRAWLVVSVIWSGFWVFLYVVGTHGMTAAELTTQRANTTFMMGLPWIAGWLLFWIFAGNRR